ncbi:MAG: multiubiquitin domain-containing protein [Cyanobacteria bacterium SZAS LIN-3]|nr:multiubiquitin domain-containing protein [Cyanobacteria bacterium SZAS LIN-3]
MSQHPATSEVRVHIDQQKYHSPTPTTGSALYALGKVDSGQELFREVHGDHEDEPIENGSGIIHLHEDEHFHSGKPKTYTVYVNGQAKTILTKRASYEEIVKLAFPNPINGQNIRYTVGYEDGPPVNPSGSLMPGHKVKVKDGMIFNVTPTDKS